MRMRGKFEPVRRMMLTWFLKFGGVDQPASRTQKPFVRGGHFRTQQREVAMRLWFDVFSTIPVREKI